MLNLGIGHLGLQGSNHPRTTSVRSPKAPAAWKDIKKVWGEIAEFLSGCTQEQHLIRARVHQPDVSKYPALEILEPRMELLKALIGPRTLIRKPCESLIGCLAAGGKNCIAHQGAADEPLHVTERGSSVTIICYTQKYFWLSTILHICSFLSGVLNVLQVFYERGISHDQVTPNVKTKRSKGRLRAQGHRD